MPERVDDTIPELPVKDLVGVSFSFCSCWLRSSACNHISAPRSYVMHGVRGTLSPPHIFVSWCTLIVICLHVLRSAGTHISPMLCGRKAGYE